MLFFKDIMMKNKIKNLAVLVAASISATAAFSSSATQTVFTGSFDTIKAVTISETTPLTIVGLGLNATNTCVLAAAATSAATTTYIGDVAMNLANTGQQNAPGTAIATTTGTGCVTSTTAGGTFGLYEVDGAAGGLVTVSLTDDTSDPDIALVVSGCAAVYNGAALGDTCVALTDLTDASMVLASAGDTSSLGEGVPVVGKGLISLGASVTVKTGRTLTAGTDYPITFQIDVTY
jgi:hypothetical protein